MGIFIALYCVVHYARYITPAVVVIALLMGVSARASDLEDFLVNDDGGIAEQNHPRIAVAADGSFVIVWVDRRVGNSDIYLQRYASGHAPIGRNVKLNDDTNLAHQTEPAIGADYSGRYSTVWRDYRNGTYPFDPDIYLQRLDSAAAPVGVNASVTVDAPDSLKESPDLALSPWGTGVVVWADYRNRNWDIYGQLLASDGSLSGTNFKVNDDNGTAQQHSPRVSVSPDGWFVVTWYDNRYGDDDVFVQRYDELGNAQGPNIRVSSDGSGNRQAFPDVAADGMGHFSVVWVDWRNATYPLNPDIYYRRYDTTMTALITDKQLNIDASLRAQREPAIAMDRMGHTSVVWADSTTSLWDISGQMIDVDGNLKGTTFKANFETDSAQVHPDVALDGRDRYVVWADKRNGNYDIYASIVRYNDPSLAATPSALKFSMDEGSSAPSSQSLTISHVGYNPLQFRVVPSEDWLSVSPTTGTTQAAVQVSIVTDTLLAGVYLGTLMLVDEDNADSSMVVSVRLDVTGTTEPPVDTIEFVSVNVGPGEQGVMPIELRSHEDILSLLLPVRYDTSLVTIDSVVFGSSVSDALTCSADWLIDPGVFVLTGDTTLGGTPLTAGERLLAEVYFTADSTEGTAHIDTAYSDTLSCAVVVDGDLHKVPVIVGGDITISMSTGIGDEWVDGLPGAFELGQNYPNPFNSETVIEYRLATSGPVRLEVFNILGQLVKSLVGGTQSFGEHRVSWDGSSESGLAAPSGIYFYRLQADGYSDVRKMVLVK